MNQNDIVTQLKEILATVMEGREMRLDGVDLSRSLYEDGYGLNSMDTASFSAMLNEQFGADPYSAGEVPHNLGEIVAYYNRAQA